MYKKCQLCPHQCSIDRTALSRLAPTSPATPLSFCRESSTPHIAWIGLHKGEEYPISGKNGSGMFFFTGCTLLCPTCQNIQISDRNRDRMLGTYMTEQEVALKMLELQSKGAETISFVTAEHFAPSVVEAVKIARDKGLKIKTVFNTSGYMKKETIELLLPFIDIWLWDMKTLSNNIAKKYFGMENYPEIEEEGLKCLVHNKADVIVRHLVLPSYIAESIDVIKHFGKYYKDDCAFSLMYQFIPPKNTNDANLLKTLTSEDIELLENTVYDCGIENGFIQEKDDNEEVWRPDFTRINPFPSNFATPLTN